jgi:hypothetical protein
MAADHYYYVLGNNSTLNTKSIRNHANRPKIKYIHIRYSIMWLNFLLYKVIIQYCTICSNKMCVLPNLKKTFHGKMAFVQGCKLPFTSVPCGKSTACFSSFWPHPSLPLIHPLNPTPTQTSDPNLRSRRRHQHRRILLGLIE